MSKIFLALSLVFILAIPVSAHAQDVDLSSKSKVELANSLHQFWSTEKQVNEMIEQMVASAPVANRTEARQSLSYILDAKKIENIAVELMAETFNKEELTALIEFYSTPVGRSAESNRAEYQKKLGVEMEKFIEERAKAVALQKATGKPAQ